VQGGSIPGDGAQCDGLLWALPRTTGQPLLYVAGQNSVSVIDTGNNAVVDAIKLAGAWTLAVSPDASRLYATTTAGLSIVDASTDKVIKTIALAGGYDLAVSPDGSRAYIGAGAVLYVVDLAADKVVATLRPAGGADSVAVRPNGGRIYATGSLGKYDPILDVIDARTMTLLATISASPFIGFGSVIVTPDGRTVYATGGGHDGLPTSLIIIDAVANKGMGAIFMCLPCGLPGLAVTPDGSQLLVPIIGPEEKDVGVVSTATNAVSARIPVAPSGGLAIRPDGRFAYVPDSAGRVEVVDTAKHAVVAKIAVPAGVGAEAIVPPPEGVQFLTLSATLAMRAAKRGAFSLQAQLTLSTSSNGIHPHAEAVRLQVGPFITTIPAGSFERAADGSFSYEGTISGAHLDVLIKPTGTLRYELDASATGANLSGASNPVQVSMSIGDDAGLTKVGASFLAAEK
jgi:DNA-binding beta-propeller fold protein YncE